MLVGNDDPVLTLAGFHLIRNDGNRHFDVNDVQLTRNPLPFTREAKSK